MDSRTVLSKLVKHLESKAMSDQYTYIPECTMPDGRRVDLLKVSNWASHGYQRVAYEIKVSRSDFLGELKQGSKTDTMLKYAHSAFFVIPKGIVTLDEVPAGCGFIEVADNGCKIIRKATTSEVTHADSHSFISSLLVQAARRHHIIKNILATGEKEITIEDLQRARGEGLSDGRKAEREIQAKWLQSDTRKAVEAEHKKYRDAIKAALAIKSYYDITDEHLESLKELKTQSPVAFQEYREIVETFCNRMLPNKQDGAS
jgi:hypothetical protein